MHNLYAIELGNEPDCKFHDTYTFQNLINLSSVYASNSPIVPSTGWSQSADAASEKSWFTAIAPSVSFFTRQKKYDLAEARRFQVGNIFQAAVYISWRTAPTIPLLGTSISTVRSVSEHSYPQSACNGATTNLTTLMSHSYVMLHIISEVWLKILSSDIVSYTAGFAADAASAHAAGVRYFFGETNSGEIPSQVCG
jgi:hypothetical protein